MGLELLVAICFWAGMGAFIDRWLGTGHWFLAVGALVGNFAGIYLIWLRSGRMQAADDARRDRRQAEDAARRREGSARLVH